MRRISSITMRAMAATALLVLAASPSHATQCFTGVEPVTAKPTYGTGQFAFQIPSSPSVGSSNHWWLVDDYEEANSGNIRTGFINTVTGVAKQELFIAETGEYEVNTGEQFNQCTIKAHMLSNRSDVPATAYLILKYSGTQSDGSAITVTGGYLQEYERVMTTNPVTSNPWTTDDVLGLVQVGIKNTADSITGNGVGYSDIVFVCE